MRHIFHLATEKPPAVVLHTLIPPWLILLHKRPTIVALPGHRLLHTWMGVVFWAAGTHVCNGPVGEDLVINARRKGHLKANDKSNVLSQLHSHRAENVTQFFCLPPQVEIWWTPQQQHPAALPAAGKSYLSICFVSYFYFVRSIVTSRGLTALRIDCGSRWLQWLISSLKYLNTSLHYSLGRKKDFHIMPVYFNLNMYMGMRIHSSSDAHHVSSPGLLNDSGCCLLQHLLLGLLGALFLKTGGV